MRMRKKRRSSLRLHMLEDLLCEDAAAVFADPAAAFESRRPLRLEIGCGKGDFIRTLSVRDDEYNYFAMEKITDVIMSAVEKYAESRDLGTLDYHGGWRCSDGTVIEGGGKYDIPLQKRGNVRFIPGDAANLKEYFPSESLESIYVNFCDPWTKAGYASRRLTHGDFLKEYLRLLTPGGYFRFKTDNIELFEFSLETVEASDFDMVYVTRDLHASERDADNIRTEYERNFSEKGFKINFIEARKPMSCAE